MRAGMLFLVLSFAVFAAAQTRGGAVSGSGARSGGASVSSSGGASGAATPSASPGMPAAPASGPAAVAPTTDTGPTSTQPNGTAAVQPTNTTGTTNTGTTNTGGFITNAPIGTASNNNGVGNTGPSSNSGYVPLLQTPTASFPSPLSVDLPVTPAGITNNPSALVYANQPSGGSYVPPITASGSNESLGEVAREYRTRTSQQAAGHVYTNADIANLDRQNQVGSPIGPQGNTSNQANSQPQSPTMPAVNNMQQPSRNSSLPAGDNQAPQTPQR